MVKYESECVGCSTIFHNCMGSACPYNSVPHFYCDECGDDVEELYEFDGEELCIDCIKGRLDKVGA